MTTLKKNVSAFNSDIKKNKGYRYTSLSKPSFFLANRRMTEAILNLITPAVKTVMDIGSGDGTYTNELKIKKPDLKIVGFDPADDAVDYARLKFPGIEFLTGNILEPASLPANKYDLAIFRGVLHHLNHPQKAISNSILMSDKLIIVEPNGNNPVLKVIEKVSPYHILHEEQSFSSKKLANWCRESGYKVVSLNFIGFIPMFFPSFLAKFVYSIQPFLEKIRPLRKYLGAQIVIYCEKA